MTYLSHRWICKNMWELLVKDRSKDNIWLNHKAG